MMALSRLYCGRVLHAYFAHDELLGCGRRKYEVFFSDDVHAYGPHHGACHNPLTEDDNHRLSCFRRM